MTSDLKPCPFCGASDDAQRRESVGFGQIWAWACVRCGARGPSMKREGSDGPLITAWNLRASDADARRTSEYWKAEHIACDAECERLRGLLREVRAEIDEQVSAHDGADPFGASCPNCAAGVPVAHSLACRIDAALRGKESE